jgi:flagellum-specific peptidoglycan hydrolase FlgJ
MKQIVNVVSLLVALWTCSCQSKESEAYLQNLAEENATLLEVIQKKNQELDLLTTQLQQLESAPVSQPLSTAANPVKGKQTDPLPLQQSRVVIASGYPTTDESTKPTALAANPASQPKVNQAVEPRNVEQFLNQISDPAIALATRKEWKKAILLAFANKQVEVFAEKKGFVNRYTAATLLDLLVYFPHQVKVSKVVKNPQDKIIQLRLQMNRQT